MEENLDIEFKRAFKKISKVEFEIPSDIRLQLYAYYKQATLGDNFDFNSESNVISAFKFNAWVQLRGITPNEAKHAYIILTKKIIK